MLEMTRREWHWIALGGVVSALRTPVRAFQTPSAQYKGVTLGVQSYSFRGLELGPAIAAMAKIGLHSCELWHSHVEPRGVSREELRRWRENVSLDEFRRIGEAFSKAGIALSAYNISFREHFTDAEIERGFEMAKALGAPCITSSSHTKAVARVAQVAARHALPVGMHNHSQIDPNEFATPQDFEQAMKVGPQIKVNLDIGHFTAANFDALDYVLRHHASILTLHIKDRKRDQGPAVPFGQGDTPIGAILRLLRDEKWSIAANIEYEYKGGNTIQEVTRCLEYCRKQLDS
jgi:sugar phosphate isomerase/epimerase